MMKNRLLFPIIICFSILIITACHTSTPPAPTIHQQVQPLTDEALRLKVEEILQSNESLSSQIIHVNTKNDTVLLTGFVTSFRQRQLAEKEVHVIPHIHIINRLTVGKAPSSWISVKDTWLTTKIHSKLIASGYFDQNHLTIITESGTVYLLGTLPKKEARLAVKLARETEGVNKVVSAIRISL